MTNRIQKGGKCYLRFAGQRVPAEIVDVCEQLIRLRCPEDGVPVRGKGLTIELDAGVGTAGFFAQVVTASPGNLHEIVLMRAPGLDRIELRGQLRVPASLKASLSNPQADGPAEADVINVSTGGMLIETDASLEVGDAVHLLITGEGQLSLEITGAVVHTYTHQPSDRDRVRAGIRFLAPDAACQQSLSWYIWKRVEQVFPSRNGA
jgi:hypothetical protein